MSFDRWTRSARGLGSFLSLTTPSVRLSPDYCISGKRRFGPDVGAILDRHYLNRDPGLADEGIRKLETRTKTPDRAPDRE